MEEQLRNPQKKETKKKDPKINDFQANDDRRGMTRPLRPVPEFHKRKDKSVARRANEYGIRKTDDHRGMMGYLSAVI